MTEQTQRDRFIAILQTVGAEYNTDPDDEDAQSNNEGIDKLLKELTSIVQSEIELACKPLKAEIARLKTCKTPQNQSTNQQEPTNIKKKPVKIAKKALVAISQEDSDEKPPAKKKATAKKVKGKVTKAKVKKVKDDESDGGETKPKTVKPYAAFTSFIGAAQKALIAEEPLDPVFSTSVTVTFLKRSAGVEALFEDEQSQPLKDMIDTEQNLEEVLKTAIAVLTEINGNAHMMKLTAIMWSALNNKQPVLTPMFEAEEADDASEADAAVAET